MKAHQTSAFIVLVLTFLNAPSDASRRDSMKIDLSGIHDKANIKMLPSKPTLEVHLFEEALAVSVSPRNGVKIHRDKSYEEFKRETYSKEEYAEHPFTIFLKEGDEKKEVQAFPLASVFLPLKDGGAPILLINGFIDYFQVESKLVTSKRTSFISPRKKIPNTNTNLKRLSFQGLSPRSSNLRKVKSPRSRNHKKPYSPRSGPLSAGTKVPAYDISFGKPSPRKVYSRSRTSRDVIVRNHVQEHVTGNINQVEQPVDFSPTFAKKARDNFNFGQELGFYFEKAMNILLPLMEVEEKTELERQAQAEMRHFQIKDMYKRAGEILLHLGYLKEYALKLEEEQAPPTFDTNLIISYAKSLGGLKELFGEHVENK